MTRILIVEDMNKYREERNNYVDDVLADKIPIDKERAQYTIVLKPESFSKLFTPQKIRLLQRIKRNKINNIYQLAKELKRPYESVHRDIKELKSYNLIKIKTKDKKKIPYMHEKITINAFT